MQKPITIPVETKPPYNVLVGEGLLDSCGARIAQLHRPCTVALVADDRVDDLYGNRAAASLAAAGFTVLRYVFPQGEASKSLARLGGLLEFLAQNHLTRTDLLVALGGGVTGDLTGFAASVYLRGVDYVQLPTTLLAGVDSAVGGKTGVNLAAGKNLCGAFHQPILVLCDTAAFDTLPREVFADGMAEVVKYGMLCCRDMLEQLAAGAPTRQQLPELVARCVEAKARLVAADEQDNGQRQLLNLGHTLGHAIEKCSRLQITHGQAVAIGMAIICRIADRQGWSDEPAAPLLCRVLEAQGLPTATSFNAAELAAAALSDKKRRGGTITLVVPNSPGQCLLRDAAVEDLQSLILCGLE